MSERRINAAGWLMVVFAIPYDLLTPDSQNATALLIGMSGFLLFILAAIRSLAKAIETQSATTAGRGPKDESAVPQGFAHPTGSIKGGDRG